jgi:hypothetical protein
LYRASDGTEVALSNYSYQSRVLKLTSKRRLFLLLCDGGQPSNMGPPGMATKGLVAGDSDEAGRRTVQRTTSGGREHHSDDARWHHGDDGIVYAPAMLVAPVCCLSLGRVEAR